ncbi:helix-turn-helix domain-containing protein [Nocardia tengchongensis]|uniref:helix-turn-helix domain-containing protein n=1 Tax=Nocardia tengchongensis TaxID=2055889 RepID=UPI00364A9537
MLISTLFRDLAKELSLLIGSDRPSTPPNRVGNFISIKTAAELVGMSPQTIRSWIKTGDLEGFRVKNGPWRVSRDELIDLVQPVRPGASDGAA